MTSSNGYPFTSRKQVLARIASEPTFAVECVALIEERRGWMASHRPRAVRLVARLAADRPTSEDLTEATALASCYAKTLARVFREREILTPKLAMQAATFGVVRSPTAMVPDVMAARLESTPVVTSATTEAAAEAPVVKKRRGRPPGAKNRKPPPEPEQPRRRRRS